MAYKQFTYFLLISSLFSLHTLRGQTDDWTKEMSKDGNIEVWHHITKRVNENGKEVMLIQYQATTTADVSLESCVRVLRNVSLHKEILEDTEVSDEIETYSANDCLIYYLFDARWPMPNSDCVVDMKYIVDSSNNSIRFEGTASPQKREKTEVKRLNHFTMIYTFKQLEDGQVEIRVYSELTPVISAPKWMANFWFPEGPAGIVKRIGHLASEIDNY